MTELNPAEQAAAEAIRDYVGNLVTSTGRSTDSLARAVVAAVLPIVEAEMLDEIAMLIGNEPTPLVQRGSIVTRLRTRAANRRLAAERQAEGDET